MQEVILGGLLSLLSVIIGILVGHFLEKDRNNKRALLDKKIQVYSDILINISSVWQSDEKNLLSDPTFLNNFRHRMARVIAAGRLLSQEKLEKKLREYYDLETKFFLKIGTPEADALNTEIIPVMLAIEQLMRAELGNEKLY